MNITVGELADPASMKLRLSYWRVALSVAQDYSGTGVGLGNFRVAYGPYQYLGAGDVQNAHNAFLQAWCETGLGGALALMAFWGYLLGWGLLRIRFTEDPARRRLLLGLYGGILAFLLHALLDINFSHPSLVMYVMAAAGLFCSHILVTGGGGHRFGRVVALTLLVVAAIAGGAALRPFLFDLATNGGRFINVSNRSLNDSRQNAAEYFLATCPAWARQGKTSPPPSLPVSEVISLLDDRDSLFTLGQILAPDPERKRMVPLAENSALPPEAIFQMRRPWDARLQVAARTMMWIRELERLDQSFPWDPQVAWQLSGLYKLLVEQGPEEEASELPRRLDGMLSWAEEAVRRSPLQKDMHLALAWAHWSCGTHGSGSESIAHLEAALASFKRSRELGHNEPMYYYAHADALAAMGHSYEKAGRPDVARGLLEEAGSVRAEGNRIQQTRWSLGLQ
jgi:tetratricopeptide (TPR) repeat protein